MSSLNTKKLGFLAAGITVFALFAVQGCGSDDNQASPSGGDVYSADQLMVR